MEGGEIQMLLRMELLKKQHLGLKAPKRRLVVLTCLRLKFTGRARESTKVTCGKSLRRHRMMCLHLC